MFQSAIGNAPSACPDHRVLFGRNAAHARIRNVLLILAIDQIIVGAIADGNEIRVDLRQSRHDRSLNFSISSCDQRPIGIPRHRCRSSKFRRRSAPRCNRRWVSPGSVEGVVLCDGSSELRAAPVAHQPIVPARAANHETDVVIDDRELRQRVLADPAQPFFIGRCIRIGIGRHARRRHMQEGEMRCRARPRWIAPNCIPAASW